MAIGPNNTTFVNAKYNLSTNEAGFFIENETIGQYASFYETIGGGQGGHYQAEWIVERTEEDGSFPPLANFGTVTLSDANAKDGSTWQGIGKWPHNYDTMVDPSNASQTDAWPGPINSAGNSFPVHWSNFGS